MDRTDEDDFNIQYQRHLDEDRLENAMSMRMGQLERLLVVERVYLCVADVGDAKNPESESESDLRCTRKILESTATPEWFGDGRVSGNQPGYMCMITRGRSYTEIAHSSHKPLAKIDDK